MTNNNFSFYLVHRGYDPIMPSEEGYRIKNPVYSKFNIKMQRYDDQMFCRFTPDIDLSLHNADFDYLFNLSYTEEGYLGLVIKIDQYLGSSETKRLFGYVSRKKCEWDFDKRKVTLKVDWIDEYTNILANWDKEFDLIKLGVPSENVQIPIQPIIQIYQRGSSLVDNFIGGEHFESNANSDLTESELINDYKFYKALEETYLGPSGESSANTIKQIASSQGYVIDSQFDPSDNFEIGNGHFGGLDDPDIISWSAYNHEGVRFYIRTVLNIGATEEQVRDLIGSGSTTRWLSNARYCNFENDPQTGDSDLSAVLDENGYLKYKIVYVYLATESGDNVLAYDYGEPRSGQTILGDPQLYFYNSFSLSSKFYFGHPSNPSVNNLSLFTIINKEPFFARLICADGGNDGYTSYLLKADELNPNSKVYKKGIPLDPDLLPSFRGVTLSLSRNFSDEFNEFGCYTVNGKNRFYLPPTYIDASNSNNAWIPVLRAQWDSTSYWVKFGDDRIRYEDPGEDFWSHLPFSRYCHLKDAYRIDNIIRVLVGEINKTRSREDKEIKVAEITNDIKTEHSSLNTVTFSRFFERISVSEYERNRSKALYNQTYGYIPYFVPASNLTSIDYAIPAQTWKVTLKKVLTWMVDLFNCYFMIRDIKGTLYFELENETFFRQGFQYEKDPDFYGDETYLFQTPYLNLGRSTLDSRNKEYYAKGQNKITFDQSLLPKRYEFSCSGEGGSLFNDFYIDMDIVNIKRTWEKSHDFSINQISDIKKITPEVYTDVDRIFASPDNFDKSGTVLLMAQKNDSYIYTHIQSVLERDGRNGVKWVRTANFYASWAALSILHTHYVHTIDEMLRSVGSSDWLGSDMIAPFSDKFNYQFVSLLDSEATTLCRADIVDSTSISNNRESEHGCNLWRGLLRGKIMQIDSEAPLWLNAMIKNYNNTYTEITANANDYLYNAVLYIEKSSSMGYFCKANTESADLNLLTGNAKFKLRSLGL